MLIPSPRFRVKHQIHDQRRLNVAKRLRLLEMARIFESPEEKKARQDLINLRCQDWK